MPTPASIQLPPNSTGSLVGTWTDSAGKHYHGMVLVDSDGNPVSFRYITHLLEEIVLLLGAEHAGPKDEERKGADDR